jgi:RNA polymerase sigma-70 factor (sigma-E family)
MRAEPEFEEAFDRLWPSCFRLARRMTGNREAAEDIAAEAMARLYAHWHRIGPLEWKDAWAMRVTTNLAIDTARRLPPPLAAERSVESEDAAVVRLALAAALRALPARQRDAVVLRYLTDLDEASVAEALGVSPGTVKSHLHRGIDALRRSLGDDLEETYLAPHAL